jgi:hypothetical protein
MSKRYSSLPEVWDSHRNKLCVYGTVTKYNNFGDEINNFAWVLILLLFCRVCFGSCRGARALWRRYEEQKKDPFFGAQLIVTPYFSLLFKSHRKMLPIHQGSSWLKEDWNDKDPQENRRSQSTTGHSLHGFANIVGASCINN